MACCSLRQRHNWSCTNRKWKNTEFPSSRNRTRDGTNYDKGMYQHLISMFGELENIFIDKVKFIGFSFIEFHFFSIIKIPKPSNDSCFYYIHHNSVFSIQLYIYFYFFHREVTVPLFLSWHQLESWPYKSKNNARPLQKYLSLLQCAHMEEFQDMSKSRSSDKV